MKIDICLMSCNENYTYYSLYPYVKHIWEKILNAKCILIYIGNEIPELLLPYKEDIILYKPKENINTTFIAQTIRLLYPALLKYIPNQNTEIKQLCEGILITDIDSIPLNRKYFCDNIANIDDSKFINYSFDPNVFSVKEHNIPYSVAIPNTWSSVFKIN